MLSRFRNLLIGLVPDEQRLGEASAAADYAIALAQRCGAGLTLQVFAPRFAWIPTGVLTDLPVQLSAAEEERLANAARAAADAILRKAEAAGLTCSLDSPALPFAELTQHFWLRARLHDLTLLDAGNELLSARRHVIGEALFRSGRPVVVVPPSGGSAAAQSVVVAWDGSACAARTLGDALPLLQAAREVNIVTVTGEKELPSLATGAELVAYLARHGVQAAAHRVPMPSGGVAQALRHEVGSRGAELLVMGAFVHSRLRESVLGGVTRSLLESCPVPLFLAH